MSKSSRFALFLLVILLVTYSAYSSAQTAPKPLRRSEVVALIAGEALPANIVHAIQARGLSFRPTDEFRAQLKTAGADATILDALAHAKAPDQSPAPDKWEQALLQSLTSAAQRMTKQQYDDAVGDLTSALKAPVDVPEVGFVMGAVLREKEEWPQAAAVYSEILREDPGFPEAHTKLSFILYRLGKIETALREAKTAIAENPENAEAHKNLGLAFSTIGKFDAAAAEYQEALRLKPDYGAVHYNLGLLLDQKRDAAGSIAEFRKAVKFSPEVADFHANLGTMLGRNGDIDGGIYELREAKRLNPKRPETRFNLAVLLEKRDLHAAINEFLELEKIAPDFEVCQKCLAGAFHAVGDDKSSLVRYRRAAELDPSDPDIPLQIGGILEEQKNYDGALAAYRKAAEMADDLGPAHLAAGKLLLIKKEYIAAIEELKKAVTLDPANAPAHEALARALSDSGDTAAALAEFKEAQTLDPRLSSAMLGLAQLLEKNGDWPAALDRYKQAALAEAAFERTQINAGPHLSTNQAQSQYRSAQVRFDSYLESLKASGKSKEAADLQARMASVEASTGVTARLQQFIQAGDEARQERRFPDAEASYKKAVDLGEKSAPTSDLLVTALEDLGGIYGIRRDFKDGDQALHRALTVIEKSSGPGSTRAVHTLQLLAANSMGQEDFAGAVTYGTRSLELSEKNPGDTNPEISNCLRLLAAAYMKLAAFDKAKPYLVRAVDINQKLYGPQDFRTVVPMYSLCMVEDHVDSPDKIADCYQHLLAGMAVVYGANNPAMLPALKSYAESLKKLGRADEATIIEQRADSIRTATRQP